MNINTTHLLLSIFTLFLLNATSIDANSQCFQVYDGLGNIQTTPYFVGCSGSDHTIFLQTDIAIGAYTVVWGDGTANSTGASLTPPAYLTHTYTATVDTFNITITETSTGCSVSGVVVLEEPVNASIQIPLGGVTMVCAPSPIDFINSSTNVSPTTTFTWDFGDGTAPLVFGPSNSWQTVTHAYQKNTVSCETVVTLTAENYCSAGNPTIALFQPLMVYDVDTAVISASATLLCYPDTVVHFSNATIKNCLPEGNTQQRYEYWNLGDYWGLGYDSIIPWVPFDPPARPGHTIAFPGVGTYSIMMIDSNMCGQDTAYQTITIIPPPTAGLSSINDSACVGEFVNFSGTSGNGANAYYWNFGNGSSYTQLGSNLNISFYDTGNITVSMIAGITGTSGVCQDTAQANIYIKPSPVASFVLDQNTACDSLTVTITDSTLGAVAWDWNFGNGNTSTQINPPAQTYSAGTHTISLEVTHQNGCSDNTSNTVTVYPSPVANFVANSVCQQDLALFTDSSISSSTDPITSWNWNFGDGNTSTSTNSSNIYANMGSYNVTLIVATPHCSDTISDSVIVEVKPTAAFTIDKNAGCSPLTVQTTNNSIGATSYIWDLGNGYGSFSANPALNYINSDTVDTTYTLTLIASTTFGCTDTTELPVTIYGSPIANFTSDANPACGPFNVNFFNQSQGAISYTWDFGDSSSTSVLENPSHLYTNTTLFITNYPVQLVATNAQGCTDTSNLNVAVYPEPNFPFTIIPDSGCSPLAVTFPAIIGAVAYQWNFGDGTTSTGQSPTHTFYNSTTNDMNFNVQLIATSPFGCKDTTIEVVTVFPEPTAIINFSDTIGCGPLSINAINGSLNAYSYVWDFGDGTTSTDTMAIHNHVYQNNTMGQVIYNTSLVATTSHGCTDSVNQNITIYPPVAADFTANLLGCTPLSVDFTNTSNGANTYHWNFGTGAVSASQDPSHTFFSNQNTDTNYLVTMIATSTFGCTDTITDSVTVYHEATASLSTSVISGCTPLDVMYTNSSYGFDNTYLSYGDGTFLNSPFTSAVHSYVNNGIVTDTNDVYIIASTIHGCNDTLSTQIAVYPPVQASFTGDTMGCSPFVVPFTNLSTGGASYQWDFGNGSLSNIPVPTATFTTGSTQSVYTTTLWTTSIYGCSDSVIMQITVNPSAVANVTPSSLNGCTPLANTFTNNSYYFDNIMWDFGDGTATSNPNTQIYHTYTNPTSSAKIYDVEFIASTLYGCNDTANFQIEVFPDVIANASFDTVGCSPFYVKFQNKSIGGYAYLWNFDNGVSSTNQNPDETFVNNGNTAKVFNVSLVTTSAYGCLDTLSRNITVHPQPIASFVATPTVQSFPNTIVSVINNTVGNYSFYWNFGGVENSNLANPNDVDFLNPGDYIISMIVTNQYCADTATETISILPPPPIADFSGGGEGCTPVSVTFENSSVYGIEYLWDFGDGNTSIQENPTYTYFVPGTYTVNLTVTGLNGVEIKTMVDVVKVYPNAVANFDFQPIKVSSQGDKTFFYNQSANADIFNWNFGDGGSSDEQNPIYQYTSVGEFPITLIANNQYNCPDTLTHSTYMTVEAKGDISFPNAFVPSASGSNGGYFNSNVMDNSVFYPISIGINEYHLVIYNRWGEKVFETFDVNQGWDGYYRGELSAQDVYVWKADVIMVSGESKVFAGDVTLIQ